ncbi:hypothetical protein WSM22_27720 [Cytophagales bacterium WSM2-2]|nr:hypothetical protein WSM22_27720 [Cytophagales bacterium WSM2-2]
MKKILLAMALATGSVFAKETDPVDSTKSVKNEPRSKSTLTTRLHTVGYFSFTGRIISTNPAFDFMYTYDRKQWGFTLFKAFDLYDHNSSNNFTLAMLRKSFKLTNRLTVTPHIGTILEQNNSFADKGSDISSIIITSYKVSNHLTIDHTAILGNLVLEQSERDWFNRFRILYSKNHWDVTALLWHNNKIMDNDNSEYFSAGLNLFYNRMKISDHLMLSAGASGLVMACSNIPSEYPKRNGVFFTLGAYIH